jgi:hypothetical protein
MAVLSRHHSYHLTYRLAVKDDAAPADPCWTLMSVAASPRHQTCQGLSPDTGCIHGRRHGQWRKGGQGGETTGTPQRSPHLEFQGEAQHHDAPQKRYSLYSHIFKSRSDSTVKIWPLEPVHDYSRFRGLFVPTLCVVVLDSS